MQHSSEIDASSWTKKNSMQTPFGVLGLKKFQKYTKGCSSLKLGKTRAQPEPSLLYYKH